MQTDQPPLGISNISPRITSWSMSGQTCRTLHKGVGPFQSSLLAHQSLAIFGQLVHVL